MISLASGMLLSAVAAPFVPPQADQARSSNATGAVGARYGYVCGECGFLNPALTDSASVAERCGNCGLAIHRVLCARCGLLNALRLRNGGLRTHCVADNANLLVRPQEKAERKMARTEARPPDNPLSVDVELGAAYRFTSVRGASEKVGEYSVLNAGIEGAVRTRLDSEHVVVEAEAGWRDGKDQGYRLKMDVDRTVFLDLNLQRFVHRLDHDPLSNLAFSSPGGDLAAQDAAAGTDFGIVRTDLETNLKVTPPWLPQVQLVARYRYVNREGHEQARTISHCVSCHVFATDKPIDQITNELELGIQAKVGPVAAYYAHTIRTFDERESAPRYDYPVVPPLANAFFPVQGNQPFSLVPDTRKDTDRVQVRWDFAGDAHLFAGYSRIRGENEFSDVAFSSDNVDARLTALPLRGLKVSLKYAFKDLDVDGPAAVDRSTNSLGIEATYALLKNLGIEAGYEWEDLERRNVLFNRLGLDGPYVRGDWTSVKNSLKLGASWLPFYRFSATLRYRYENTRNPLTKFGKQESYAPATGTTPYPNVPGVYPDLSSLPTDAHLLTLLVNWRPSERWNLSLSTNLRRAQNTDVDFEQTEFMPTLTVSYLASEEFSILVSGGYLWAETTATLVYGMTGGLSSEGAGWVDLDEDTRYVARIPTLSATLAYAPSRETAFTATYFVTHASASFDSADVSSDIGGFSKLTVVRQGLHVTARHTVRKGFDLTSSVRVEDYDDKEDEVNNGTAIVILFGGEARF